MKRTSVGLSSAVAIVTMAGGLAACSPSSPAGSGGGGEQGSGTGAVKMVLWPGPEGDAMGKVVEQYNAGQGKTDKITVEMTLLSRQDTFSKEATLMAAKSADQDIYFVASYNVGQFAASLEPLKSIDASNYFPVAVEGLQYQGKQFALPLDVSNHFLLYRKDLIDPMVADPAQKSAYQAIAQKAVGQPLEPKPADEWTWDDYIAMSAYFSQGTNSSSPTKYGTILQAKNLLYNTMIWNDVLWGLGGSWTTADGKANLNTPQAEKAVNVYATIYKDGWTSPDSSQAEFPETQAALKSGSAAFAVQWSAGFAELNDPAKSPEVAGKIAIAPTPGGKTHVHALAVALNKYSTNKAAATKFMEFLATPQAMATYADAGGIPAMPQVLKDKQSVNPAFASIATTIAKNGYAEPVFPKAFQAYSSLAEDLSGAWVGTVDAKQAVQTANTNLQSLLG